MFVKFYMFWVGLNNPVFFIGHTKIYSMSNCIGHLFYVQFDAESIEKL